MNNGELINEALFNLPWHRYRNIVTSKYFEFQVARHKGSQIRIAEAAGLHPASVGARLKKTRVDPSKVKRTKGPIRKFDYDRIVKLEREGALTQKQIADVVGCCRCTVVRALHGKHKQVAAKRKRAKVWDWKIPKRPRVECINAIYEHMNNPLRSVPPS